MNLQEAKRMRRRSAEAFSRWDVAAIVTALGLVAVVALPLAGNPPTYPDISIRGRSKRLVCQANLRDIGRAYQLWASDHGDRNPFLVDTNEGGLRGLLVAGNVWYQFAAISNELRTPSILACPADTNTTRIARDFSDRADGGFLFPEYRNNAVSYFLSMHAFFYAPRSILAGDRNAQPASGGPQSCAACLLPTCLRLEGFPNPPSSWTSGIHSPRGNLVFNDGRVQETSSAQLQSALTAPETDNSRIHALFPR